VIFTHRTRRNVRMRTSVQLTSAAVFFSPGSRVMVRFKALTRAVTPARQEALWTTNPRSVLG
jgi:hypothetical protein